MWLSLRREHKAECVASVRIQTLWDTSWPGVSPHNDVLAPPHEMSLEQLQNELNGGKSFAYGPTIYNIIELHPRRFWHDFLWTDANTGTQFKLVFVGVGGNQDKWCAWEVERNGYRQLPLLLVKSETGCVILGPIDAPWPLRFPAALFWVLLLICVALWRRLRPMIAEFMLATSVLCAAMCLHVFGLRWYETSFVEQIWLPSISDWFEVEFGEGGIWIAGVSSAMLVGSIVTVLLVKLGLWRRDLYPHCPACGYNLTGNLSGTCPECGKAVPAEYAARLAAGER
jgi:hypothetical protein